MSWVWLHKLYIARSSTIAASGDADNFINHTIYLEQDLYTKHADTSVITQKNGFGAVRGGRNHTERLGNEEPTAHV